MIDQPTLDGQPLNDNTKPQELSDEALRRLNHADWLEQFSQVLGLRGPGSPPLTPMRQGAITRLRFAAQYLQLLKQDLGDAHKQIAALKKELNDVHRRNQSDKATGPDQ